jgi:hypothetical protein
MSAICFSRVSRETLSVPHEMMTVEALLFKRKVDYQTSLYFERSYL